MVMGEDNLYTLHKWKNALELVSRFPIYVYPRRDVIRTKNDLLDELLAKADDQMGQCASDGYFRDFYKGRNQTGEKHVIFSSSCSLEIYRGYAFLRKVIMLKVKNYTEGRPLGGREVTEIHRVIKVARFLLCGTQCFLSGSLCNQKRNHVLNSQTFWISLMISWPRFSAISFSGISL